jgi:hypothetical protein
VWRQFLEGNDIGLLASGSHEIAWIGLPLAEVRRDDPKPDTRSSDGIRTAV